MARRPLSSLSLPIAASERAMRVLPIGVAGRLMGWIMRRQGPRIMKLRAIRDNLRAACPGIDEARLDSLVEEVLASMGHLMVEVANVAAFCRGTRGTSMQVGGALDYPFRQKGPAIFVGGHLGNWEMVPVMLGQQGIRLTIIQTPVPHPGLHRRLMALREQTGATYVETAKALRACAAALKRGESLALLVDQRVDSGVEVEFLGHRTLFTHFPARMALKFGCPIIVMDCWRTAPGKLEIELMEPLWPADFTGEDAEQAMTQRVATLVEETIRRHPGQWFCNKRRVPRQEVEGAAAATPSAAAEEARPEAVPAPPRAAAGGGR